MSGKPTKRERLNSKNKNNNTNNNTRKKNRKPKFFINNSNAFTIRGVNKYRPRPLRAPAYFGNERPRNRETKNRFSNLRNSAWEQKGYKRYNGNDVNEGDKLLYAEEDGRILEVEIVRVDVLPDFRDYSAENKTFFIIKSKGDTFAVFNYTRGKHWDFYEKIDSPIVFKRNRTAGAHRLAHSPIAITRDPSARNNK